MKLFVLSVLVLFPAFAPSCVSCQQDTDLVVAHDHDVPENGDVICSTCAESNTSYQGKKTIKLYEEAGRQCCICLEDDASTIVSKKCGHVTCEDCARKLINGAEFKCPLCKKESSVVMRIYDGENRKRPESATGSNADLKFPDTNHSEDLPIEERFDLGYPQYQGWYDVQNIGVCTDWCRWVGDGSPMDRIDPASPRLARQPVPFEILNGDRKLRWACTKPDHEGRRRSNKYTYWGTEWNFVKGEKGKPPGRFWAN